jgi:hypothetical protein
MMALGAFLVSGTTNPQRESLEDAERCELLNGK